MRRAVIKIGGALLQSQEQMKAFWHSVKQLREDNMQVTVVHGGGPQATSMARRLGHEPTIVEGRRITSDLDLDIMHWVLCGELNTSLVAQAAASGLPATGIKGIDARTVQVHKRPPWTVQGRSVDFGHVGDIDAIDPSLLNLLLNNNYVPVLSPLGIDADGNTYNVNADTIAQAVAASLQAHLFLLVTESGGVRQDPKDEKTLLPQINENQFAAGKERGWIQGGMLVKLKVAFEAYRSGIPEVWITQPDDMYSRLKGTRVL